MSLAKGSQWVSLFTVHFLPVLFEVTARKIFKTSKSDHATSQFKPFIFLLTSYCHLNENQTTSCGPQRPAHLTNPILSCSLTHYIPTTIAFSHFPTSPPMALAPAVSAAWNALLPILQPLGILSFRLTDYLLWEISPSRVHSGGGFLGLTASLFPSLHVPRLIIMCTFATEPV